MIQKTVSIENDLFNAFVHGPLGEQFSGKNRFGDFVLKLGLIFHRFFVTAGSHDGFSGGVVDNLAVNVFGASKNTEPGSFYSAYNLLGDSFFSFQFPS